MQGALVWGLPWAVRKRLGVDLSDRIESEAVQLECAEIKKLITSTDDPCTGLTYWALLREGN